MAEKKLDNLMEAAKAAHVTYLIQKMRSGKQMSVGEHKTLTKYLDERDAEKNAPGGRFMTASAVADHYGVRKATISRHVKLNHIKMNPDGTFDKTNTDAYYCGKLGRQMKTMAGVDIPGNGSSAVGEPTTSEQYEVERLRKITAEADAKECFAGQLQGALVPMESVELYMGRRATLYKTLLESLIGRLPPLLVGLSQVEMRSAVKKEVNRILTAFCENGEFTA